MDNKTLDIRDEVFLMMRSMIADAKNVILMDRMGAIHELDRIAISLDVLVSEDSHHCVLDWEKLRTDVLWMDKIDWDIKQIKETLSGHIKKLKVQHPTWDTGFDRRYPTYNTEDTN
tara:strand:+ start:111 stop:458 length:348 start_codon:yes stop_codon:yes gene_type:complete